MTYFKMFMCTLEENVYSCFYDKEIIIKITNNMHLHKSYIYYIHVFFSNLDFVIFLIKTNFI